MQVDLRNRSRLDAAMPHIRDNPDDRARAAPVGKHDAVRARVAARQILPREGFVNDRGLRGAGTVAGIEGPSSRDRDSHRTEIVGGALLDIGAALLPVARIAFDLERQVRISAG